MQLADPVDVRLSINPQSPTGVRGTFALVLGLFFTWGLCAALNDLLVADLRGLFHLSYRSATLVQSAYFGTAFLCAMPAARVLKRLRYHRSMTAGLAVMAAGSLLFLPVTFRGVFALLLVPVVVLSAGSTLLQTAAGPYVTMLGPERSAASRFSLALAVNSFGAAVAPAAGGFLLLGRRHASLQALRWPYAGLSLSLLLLAAVVRKAHFPDPAPSLAPRRGSAGGNHGLRWLLRERRLLGGVAAMTAYVGAEIAIGSLLINFLELPNVLASAPRHAATLAALYGAGAMLGRIGGVYLLKRLRPLRVAGCSALTAIILVAASAFGVGPSAAAALIAVGLCNSIMVPVIFTSALAGLGERTEEGAGLLVAALLGGALLPVVQGSLADRLGLQHSFLLLTIPYAGVAAYAGFYGWPKTGKLR